ncbi:MAG: nucleotidyltransferase domain-containing protein [Bacteroidales bacterium]|nr:nucleotidyltransferase domain-containing protein [Bacteroidales bacterium]
MFSLGDTIREARLEKELPLRVVAAYLEIDQSILSKIECGKRNARRDLVLKLAHYYELDPEYLIKLWLSDRILDELVGESHPEAVLRVAEEALAYKKSVPVSRASLLKQFRRVMEDFPAIQKAWIFGSFARNEEGPFSDIDILIEVPESLTFSLFDIAEVRKKLQNHTPKEIDLVMSRALKPEVLERVMKERRLFYEV